MTTLVKLAKVLLITGMAALAVFVALAAIFLSLLSDLQFG